VLAHQASAAKNSFENLSHFLSRQNVVHHHHGYHAIHHKVTSKTPQSAHRFSQKPLQKHSFTSGKKYAHFTLTSPRF
jgi:hypothetical protein